MWVSSSPPIARVQQRLVVKLIDVHSTSTKKWTPPRIFLEIIIRQHLSFRVMLIEYYQIDNIQKLVLSYQFLCNGLTPLYFISSKVLTKKCSTDMIHPGAL